MIAVGPAFQALHGGRVPRGDSMDVEANYVFLHGGGQGSWVWEETIAALARQTAGEFGNALAIDIPGCGSKRGLDTSRIDVPQIVAGLVGDIEAAGFQNVVLVGHSQAGTILPLLIEARRALFRRVIYVSCVAPLVGESVLTWRASMPVAETALMSTEPPGSRERYRVMFCNDMTAGQAEAFLDKLGKDVWPSSSYQASAWRYDHLDAFPSSYVQCLRDATLVSGWQEIFANRLKTKRIIRLDAAHQAMNTRPQALAEILRLEAAAVD